jgi:signal transduction histidine kinase
VVAIRDTGPGIPPDVIGRIFDPFFTTKGVGEGTGLGLAVSYGIVRDHGGAIEVFSEPRRGSRFTIALPLRA